MQLRFQPRLLLLPSKSDIHRIAHQTDCLHPSQSEATVRIRGWQLFLFACFEMSGIDGGDVMVLGALQVEPSEKALQLVALDIVLSGEIDGGCEEVVACQWWFQLGTCCPREILDGPQIFIEFLFQELFVFFGITRGVATGSVSLR
jgi:hypothetical protein